MLMDLLPDELLKLIIGKILESNPIFSKEPNDIFKIIKIYRM